MKRILAIWLMLCISCASITAQDIILSNQQLTATDPDNISSFLIGEIPNLARNNSGLLLFHQVRSASAQHYTFRQTYLDVEIYGTEVKVYVRSNGVVNHYMEQTINVRSWRTGFLAQSNNNTLHNQLGLFYVSDNYGANSTFEFDLCIFVDAENEPQLCLRMQVHDPNVAAYDEVLLNMQGEAVLVRDTRVFINDTTVSVSVFNPDPLTSALKTYGAPYVDDNDTDVQVLVDEIVYPTTQVTYDTGT